MTAHKPPSITLEARTSQHANALFAVLADPILYQYIEEPFLLSVEASRQQFVLGLQRQTTDHDVLLQHAPNDATALGTTS